MEIHEQSQDTKISISKSVVYYCKVLVCTKMSAWPEIVKAASKHALLYPQKNLTHY